MTFDLRDEIDIEAFKIDCDMHLHFGNLVEQKAIKPTRTNLQNRALHKFFRMISDKLNDMGITHAYAGITGQELETTWTEGMVKELIWRPIQKAMFNFESTKDLDTYKMNKIIDPIIKFFGEKGVSISFPSREMQQLEELEKAGVINKT